MKGALLFDLDDTLVVEAAAAAESFAATAVEAAVAKGGVPGSALNHTMLDSLDGLAAWLDDGSSRRSRTGIEEPADPETWRWVATCLIVAATYE